MPKFSVSYVLSILLITVILQCFSMRSWAENDKILARGQGFEITKSYVQAIEDFYKIMSFTSTEEQHLQTAIRTRIFALEAEARGLEPVNYQIDEKVVTPETVRDVSLVEQFVRDLSLAEAFSRELKSQYHIPDKVIESYYHTNWERFIEDPSDAKHLMPMDEVRVDKVRKQIMNTMQKRIIDQAYQELSEKYGVVVND